MWISFTKCFFPVTLQLLYYILRHAAKCFVNKKKQTGAAIGPCGLLFISTAILCQYKHISWHLMPFSFLSLLYCELKQSHGMQNNDLLVQEHCKVEVTQSIV